MRFSMKAFMFEVEAKNKRFGISHFSLFRESSLEPLIRILGGAYDSVRLDDWREMSNDGAARVKAFFFGLPADKQAKYLEAFEYLTQWNAAPRIKSTEKFIAFHADGKYATTHKSPKWHHVYRYSRGDALEGEGKFGWHEELPGTGWIETKPERARIGPMMVHYQAKVLCRGAGRIYCGTPQGQYALVFREGIGFRAVDSGIERGMVADVARVLGLTAARCPGWRFV